MGQKFFEKLDLAHLALEKPSNTYYIFKENKEIIEIQASTVSEALEKTAIKNAVKVVNINEQIYNEDIIKDKLKIIPTSKDSDIC